MAEKEVRAGTLCCVLDIDNRAEMGAQFLHGLREYLNFNKCKDILSGDSEYPLNPDFIDNVPGALSRGKPVTPVRPIPGASLADCNRWDKDIVLHIAIVANLTRDRKYYDDKSDFSSELADRRFS